ncbi:hypothetical protein LTR85_005800 [Meristemomyces frigidus]|nr:hypothetical protein LTR85_005800 [Meristemomyces frigidus]
MPTHLLPRNSGAHRIAAIALYRALLTQCRALPRVERYQRDELQNIVRNRFKQARHEQSPRRLVLNFEAGYEAVDYLDVAVAGDEESRRYIIKLLEQAPEKVKQAPPVVLPKILQKEVKKQQRRAAAEEFDKTGQKKLSLFDRPLPLEKLSGKRHVPVLYSAQKIPVLRLKKPQPEKLSGYLAHRLRLRQKRHDMRHRLEDELDIARSEDRWDGFVSKLAAVESPSSEDAASYGGGERKEPAWSAAVSLARKEVTGRLEEEKRKNGEMAVLMQGVVDREREVYEREKVEKEEARKGRWLAKLREWKREKREGAQAD